MFSYLWKNLFGSNSKTNGETHISLGLVCYLYIYLHTKIMKKTELSIQGFRNKTYF